MNETKKTKDTWYMSKSRMSTYQNCPFAYYLGYVKGIKGGNIYTEIGIEVHDFIDEMFTIIKPNPNSKLDDIGKLKLTPNLDYKKNILLLEANRWRNICLKEKDISYFAPTISEEKMYDNENEIVGIVDRVHKCHLGDAFAPDIRKFPEFKDGDLVIVENKTGTYDKQKAISYEEELLWYRHLIKCNYNYDIRWGAIYFPKGNQVHFFDLNDEKFDWDSLLNRINKIRNMINEELFLPTPGYSCNGCFYSEMCEYSQNGCK